MRVITLFRCSAALVAMASSLAQAAWPEMPIRVVVPYAAGSAGDLIMRQMLPALQATFYPQSFRILKMRCPAQTRNWAH